MNLKELKEAIDRNVLNSQNPYEKNVYIRVRGLLEGLEVEDVKPATKTTGKKK